MEPTPPTESAAEPDDADQPVDAPTEDPEKPEDAAGSEEEAPAKPRLSRRKLILLVGPIVVLAIVGTVTSALTPAIVTQHPLLLIALEARNRNLILAREVDFLPFLLVACFRRTLTDPLYFILGRVYGDSAVRWLEVKAGLGSYARMMERVFKKAAYPAVFFFPGAIVCALAGVIGMRFGVFFALNLAGTITAVVALKLFGDVVASPVESFVDFLDRNLLVTTMISIVLVALSVILGRTQAAQEMSMRNIEEELEGKASGSGSGQDSGRQGDAEPAQNE